MTDVIGEILGTPSEAQLASDDAAIAALSETVVPVAEAIVEVANALETPTEPTTDPDDDIVAKLLGSILPAAEVSPWLRICIFGEPGVRKTSFAASGGTTLIYEVDFGGSKSLLNHAELRNTRVLPFKSMFQAENLIRLLGTDREEFNDIEVFVVDTYSGLEQKSLARFGTLSDGRPDYNSNSGAMKALTDSLRQVRKHVVVTCHIKEEKDDSTGAILRRPDMTPGVAKALSGMFDIIGYMDVKDGEWTLRLLKQGSTSAKSRIGGLPDVMVDPNLKTIIDAYNAMRSNQPN